MLHLTVKPGGYLMIGDDIKLIFLKSKSPGKLQIAISAPKSLEIRRDKVFEKELLGYVNDPERTQEEVLRAVDRLLKVRENKPRPRTDADESREGPRPGESKRFENEAAEFPGNKAGVIGAHASNS